MLSKLKLQTLKQKLWAIVLASFLARAVAFVLLPSAPTSLALDEETYAALTKWIGESRPAEKFPLFGEGLYLSGRAIIVPASLLFRAGINELEAIRIASSIYGLLALAVIASALLAIFKKNNEDSNDYKRQEKLIVWVFLILAFMPSHFVWSILGLRESANEFWLISSFLCTFFIYRENQKHKTILGTLLALSIICTFSSRPQVGWVLVVSLILYSLLSLKTRITYFFLPVVLIGIFIGYLAITPTISVISNNFVAKEYGHAPTKDSKSDRILAARKCTSDNLIVEFDSKMYKCSIASTNIDGKRQSSLSSLATNQLKTLPERQEINQVGAASKIEKLNCPWIESSQTRKYACLGFRAPYTTITFLFRPLPLIDTTSTSSFFAGIENLVWISMFGLFLFEVIRRKRIPFIKDFSPSIIFLVLYSVGAGAYEGNMGTAFRHKSLILWIILVGLLVVSKKSRVQKAI